MDRRRALLISGDGEMMSAHGTAWRHAEAQFEALAVKRVTARRQTRAGRIHRSQTDGTRVVEPTISERQSGQRKNVAGGSEVLADRVGTSLKWLDDQQPGMQVGLDGRTHALTDEFCSQHQAGSRHGSTDQQCVDEDEIKNKIPTEAHAQHARHHLQSSIGYCIMSFFYTIIRV